MRKILLTLSMAMMAVLSACTYSDVVFVNESTLSVRGVILPHHNIVGEYIDEMYKDIASRKIERVIVISTNHFNVGGDYILTDTNLASEVNLDLDLMNYLDEKKALSIEHGTFNNEHGIKVHTARIDGAFPNAKVLPIIIKWQTSEKNLNKLIRTILEKVDMDKTLVVASIDFSHYVKEETALLNDENIQDWLRSWPAKRMALKLANVLDLEKSASMDTDVSTAMDSPETFYVFTNLMQRSAKDQMQVEIIRRTSSLSYTNNIQADPMQNTSHLFVKVR